MDLPNYLPKIINIICFDRIQNIIDHGVPPYKIILGMPTYGRSWSIRDPHQWLPMQPPVQAKGAAPAGFLTKAAGSMGYMEICLKVKNAGWIEVDDPEGPYAYSKDRSIWVGYDTPGSAADKAYYIIERGLGGAMIWDLPQDDFSVSFYFFIGVQSLFKENNKPPILYRMLVERVNFLS